MKTTLIIEITHSKPLKDITDMAAGRIYSMDGIEDVEARIVDKDEQVSIVSPVIECANSAT